MENKGVFLATGLTPIVVTALIIRYKLKKKELEMRGSDPQLGPEVEALRAQWAEMQERLDFTERLLAGGPASEEDTSARRYTSLASKSPTTSSGVKLYHYRAA